MLIDFTGAWRARKADQGTTNNIVSLPVTAADASWANTATRIAYFEDFIDSIAMIIKTSGGL